MRAIKSEAASGGILSRRPNTSISIDSMSSKLTPENWGIHLLAPAVIFPQSLPSPERQGTPAMLNPLDIFIKMDDGTYVWKAAADSFELAKSTVQRLAENSPGDYMIFNQDTGNKIMVKDGLPEPGAAV